MLKLLQLTAAVFSMAGYHISLLKFASGLLRFV